MCLHNKKINFDKNIQKLEKLEKSFYFTVKIAVFQNSVYWVYLAGDLIFGFQASPDIN